MPSRMSWAISWLRCARLARSSPRRTLSFSTRTFSTSPCCWSPSYARWLLMNGSPSRRVREVDLALRVAEDLVVELVGPPVVPEDRLLARDRDRDRPVVVAPSAPRHPRRARGGEDERHLAVVDARRALGASRSGAARAPAGSAFSSSLASLSVRRRATSRVQVWCWSCPWHRRPRSVLVPSPFVSWTPFTPGSVLVTPASASSSSSVLPLLEQLLEIVPVLRGDHGQRLHAGGDLHQVRGDVLDRIRRREAARPPRDALPALVS
jgi:hypothetical protein